MKGTTLRDITYNVDTASSQNLPSPSEDLKIPIQTHLNFRSEGNRKGIIPCRMIKFLFWKCCDVFRRKREEETAWDWLT